MDNKQQIVRTNGMARHMFGHRLTGKLMHEVIPIDDLSFAIKNVTQMNEIEFTLQGEITRDYIGKVTKFPANSPSHTDTILSLHDLTELKRIRRMRADFVANASHEMKTPLASIIGLIETLQTSAKDDPQARKQFLAIMAEQADRMKRLIADLLSLSKIEAETNLPDEKTDIGRVLQESKRHCDWLAEQKKMQVKLDIDSSLPEVAGDEDQLVQVFINLITNSIKYGHAESEILVQAKISRKLPIELNDKFDKAICITIEDKSDGIPHEHIARLTERFYRVDSARTRKLGGTGLGLAIVKHILNRHNGVLKIESVVGKGSKWSVFLPLADSFVIANSGEQNIEISEVKNEED
jgi:two-component system phosphate regulon sensor histidine kinase PhoR